jgi:hypothetical protein
MGETQGQADRRCSVRVEAYGAGLPPVSAEEPGFVEFDLPERFNAPGLTLIAGIRVRRDAGGTQPEIAHVPPRINLSLDVREAALLFGHLHGLVYLRLRADQHDPMSEAAVLSAVRDRLHGQLLKWPDTNVAIDCYIERRREGTAAS